MNAQHKGNVYARTVAPKSEPTSGVFRFRSKRFAILFTVSIVSAFLGAELVHRIYSPNLEVPHLPPDFEGLHKEREQAKQNSSW
jgi:hypothetical protein